MKYFKTVHGYNGVTLPDRDNAMMFDLDTHYVCKNEKNLISRCFLKAEFQAKYHPDLADSVEALKHFTATEYSVVSTEGWIIVLDNTDSGKNLGDLCETFGIRVVKS